MKLIQTPHTRALVARWSEGKDKQSELAATNEWIDHALLIRCCKDLDESLKEAVKGTRVYFAPPPAPPAKSKEYLKMMEELRMMAQEKEYKELAGIHDETGPIFAGSDVKQVKEELTTILNFAVSVVAVGFALWYWAKWWPLPERTLLSILGALLVLVAEVVVYAGYREKVDAARKLERAKKDDGTVREIITFKPGQEPDRLIVDPELMKLVAGKPEKKQRPKRKQKVRATGFDEKHLTRRSVAT